MCGIVAVTGRQPALPILLQGLSRLEYRGYDSAGVVLQNDGLWLEKKAGKLANLVGAIDDAPRTPVAGIGHTRWPRTASPSTTTPTHISITLATWRSCTTGSSRTTSS